MKRIIPIFLLVVFLVSSVMTITVLAISNPIVTQDNLTATITTDQPNYTKSDDVVVKVEVINNNAFPVSNVGISLTLPNNLKVKTGSLTNTPASLAVNATATHDMIAVYNPPAPPASGGSGNANPQTGDDSAVLLWITLAVLSGGLLIFMAIKKKRLKNIVLILLCLAIIGTVAVPVCVSAASRSFTVSEDITFDGSTVTITATISYNYVDIWDGTIAAGFSEGDGFLQIPI